VQGPQTAAGVSIVIDTGSVKKPTADGGKRGATKAGPVPPALIGRRLAGLPAPMWFTGAAILAAAVLGAAFWLWLRSPSDSGNATDDPVEVEPEAAEDRAAAKSSSTKPDKAGSSGPRKQTSPPKAKRPDSRRGQKPADAGVSAEPSPLDDLSKLVPPEREAKAAPQSAKEAAKDAATTADK
jgi:hypothetical protein